MISLHVNSKIYQGWKSARVTRGIESIAGGFELTVADRWNDEKPWAIYEEDACEVRLGDETVITGYVDRRSLSYAGEDRLLSVAGRDAAGALVDCSALPDAWEFKNTDILTLVERLCEPHEIAVSLQFGLDLPPPPSKFAIDPGESVFDAVERACRHFGLLAVSDGAGRLTLMRPGSARTASALEEGKNILAASADYDATGRYAWYTVLGQHRGTDAFHGSDAAKIKAIAYDAAVKRGARSLVIRPDANVTKAHAQKRAEWEAITRAARGDSVTVKVQGWTQADGTLWPVNAQVPIRSPSLGIDGTMLISQATYEVSDAGGTTTTLTLRRPDAFKPEPTVEEPTKGNNYWKEIARGV